MEQTMKKQKTALTPDEKQRKRSRTMRRIRQYFPFYIMLLPGLIYLLINNYLPMTGLVIAFKKIDYSLGIFASPWVGLSNFTYLFSNNDGINALRNTILYTLGFIVFGNILAIVVAIALDCVASKFLRRFSQVVILIPFLLSTVIISYIVFAFLSPTTGFMNNSILPIFGIESIKWYNEPGYWPVIITIVYLWMSFGYNSILYYSTLISIDKSLYEAAVIDGASSWQQIRHVTLPGLKFTIITLVLLAVGRICYSDFGLFYQIPQHSGMLYSTTQTIDTYVYRLGIQQAQYSVGAAVGLFKSLISAILVVTSYVLADKVAGYRIL